MPKKPARTARGYDRFTEEEVQAMRDASFPDLKFTQAVRGVCARDICALLKLSKHTVDGWIRRGEFPVPIGVKATSHGGTPPWCYPGKIITWIEHAQASQKKAGRPRLNLRNSVAPRYRKELQWGPVFTKTGRMVVQPSPNFVPRLVVTGQHKGVPRWLSSVEKAITHHDADSKKPKGPNLETIVAYHERERLRKKKRDWEKKQQKLKELE